MNHRKLAVLLVSLALVATATTASAKTPARSAEAQKVYAQIEQQFGAVPTFLSAVSDDVIGSVWQEFGTLTFAESTLPGKVKELIGLAVAAQIPCDYCAYAHRKFARLNGASADEVREAVMVSGMVRRWSLYLNGMRFNVKKYEREIDRMLAHAAKAKPSTGPEAALVTPEDAREDIVKTFGFVPTFLKGYPEQGLAGAWSQFKTVALEPGALHPKHRELISLSVAAQIPCNYCVIAHTKVARMFGATDQEITEALAIAGMTRQWSTFMHGMQIDLNQHKREVDALVRRMRRHAAK